MTAIRQWVAEFDLGQFLGVGLDTAQIGYLAGALFLALLGVSALRRATRAGGPGAAFWIAVAVGLFTGALVTPASGFPDLVPDDLRAWAQPDRLFRAAAVVALFGFSLVLLSAHWVRRPLWRFCVRALGLAATGTALWLAAGWFGEQLPDEARPWVAREVVTRVMVVAALLFLAGTLWLRPADEPPHRRWAARALAAPALAAAVVCGLRWFGRLAWANLPVTDVTQVTAMLAAVATGTCGLISAGAFVLRDRPARRPPVRRSPAEPLPMAEAEPGRALPVAIMLDDTGRPVLPVAPPHAPSGRA
jgi:MFS family permease